MQQDDEALGNEGEHAKEKPGRGGEQAARLGVSGPRAAALAPPATTTTGAQTILCVPNTHPIRSRYGSVLANQSSENLVASVAVSGWARRSDLTDLADRPVPAGREVDAGGARCSARGIQ